MKALCELFPNIGIDEMKFPVLPRNYWANANNQREFFVQFAIGNKFDPLVPTNWYDVSRTQILSKKAARSVLAYYSNSFRKALLCLFPDIGVDEVMFKRNLQKRKRKDIERRDEG